LLKLYLRPNLLNTFDAIHCATAVAEHGGLIKKKRTENSWVKLKVFPTNVWRPNKWTENYDKLNLLQQQTDQVKVTHIILFLRQRQFHFPPTLYVIFIHKPLSMITKTQMFEPEMASYMDGRVTKR